MKKYKLLIALLFILAFELVYSQQPTGQLKGRIIDRATKQSIPGAMVSIKGCVYILLQAKIVRLSAHVEVSAIPMAIGNDPSELMLFHQSWPQAGSIIYQIIALPQSQKFIPDSYRDFCDFGFHYEYLMHHLG